MKTVMALVGTIILGSVVSAQSQQSTTTDIGTLDKELAEKAFKNWPYFPLRRTQFSNAATFWRHAYTHIILHGRWRVWREARSA